MKILSAQQLKDWDQFTIEAASISSVDLMERAATACANWLLAKDWAHKQFYVFCGKGNNGGDGLAIARLLLTSGINVSVYILEYGKIGSADFQKNLERLHQFHFTALHFIQSIDQLPAIDPAGIVVDAIFGSGLNKNLDTLASAIVSHINDSQATVVSIDLPSGLFIDQSSLKNTVVKATFTLSFECYKLALLVQENAPFIGDVVILPIGLHPGYLQQVNEAAEVVDEEIIHSIYKPRNRFAHKGSYGHALLIGGSYGKMGAMILATKACLRAGAGLTTIFIPRCGYTIMQMAMPEAMTLTDADENYLTGLPDAVDKFTAVGIGPGMDTKEGPQKVLSFIIRRYKKPMVIDADGLNCLSAQQELLSDLPPYSVLTPHPKEFDRLFGNHQNDFDRINTAKEKAKALQVIIVLKSHHTLIALPDGRQYFNSTGNAGMAKGGSGDALTGIITSLLAQGYKPEQAAVFGVYIHGKAGDFAAKKYALESMLPSHLIEALSDVFLSL